MKQKFLGELRLKEVFLIFLNILLVLKITTALFQARFLIFRYFVLYLRRHWCKKTGIRNSLSSKYISAFWGCVSVVTFSPPSAYKAADLSWRHPTFIPFCFPTSIPHGNFPHSWFLPYSQILITSSFFFSVCFFQFILLPVLHLLYVNVLTTILHLFIVYFVLLLTFAE